MGNGGYGGTFNYFRLGEALASGYATSSTDTGHKGTSAESQWSIGHPEKHIDFDYRAIHETARVAKAAIGAFYERAPEKLYFNSCSNGGRQGLMEAERFPDDYDGIMAGAPSVHWGFGTFVSGQLEPFRDRGGKVMIYYGGNDTPRLALDYYKQLVTRMGQQRVDGFLQFYLVPGMGHCGSGPVPNDFGQWLRPQADAQHSMFKALERWVEKGVVPESVIATQYRTDGDPATGVLRTRPICPYPSEAEWTGAGNQDDAVNYACKAPLGK